MEDHLWQGQTICENHGVPYTWSQGPTAVVAGTNWGCNRPHSFLRCLQQA